ncbi:unnamed protein product [Lepeophtheirus salmonis]|uniref:(salmon louse) hypothetical protein n=1 Tax=Lepeophtheirus salmonis TaxID=72036 RepID=A0A7R8CHP9_LEPSM|nr:unnamed protein product [Lepeophtheirus salmonis]CAF2822450.1 unnamed protein product [Lepeophtheirus salmonis]
MASNSSNIESESGEEKNSNLFGLDEQKASERGAKVRPKSSSLSNRKLKNSTAIRPKSVPKSAHSNNKKKLCVSHKLSNSIITPDISISALREVYHVHAKFINLYFSLQETQKFTTSTHQPFYGNSRVKLSSS